MFYISYHYAYVSPDCQLHSPGIIYASPSSIINYFGSIPLSFYLSYPLPT